MSRKQETGMPGTHIISRAKPPIGSHGIQVFGFKDVIHEWKAAEWDLIPDVFVLKAGIRFSYLG